MNNPEETEITELEKEFKEVAEKINDFTNVLNKYNLEYSIKYFDELATIEVQNVDIQFFYKGRIGFEPKENDN